MKVEAAADQVRPLRVDPLEQRAGEEERAEEVFEQVQSTVSRASRLPTFLTWEKVFHQR